MSWGAGGGGGRLNRKMFLIGSILSVKNERSCKNGGVKRLMFWPSHTEQGLCFSCILSYILVQ